jgi:hypothetical protein
MTRLLKLFPTYKLFELLASRTEKPCQDRTSLFFVECAAPPTPQLQQRVKRLYGRTFRFCLLAHHSRARPHPSTLPTTTLPHVVAIRTTESSMGVSNSTAMSVSSIGLSQCPQLRSSATVLHQSAVYRRLSSVSHVRSDGCLQPHRAAVWTEPAPPKCASTR